MNVSTKKGFLKGEILMKRIMSVALGAAMMLGLLVGCSGGNSGNNSNAGGESGLYTPGTYTASADGFEGPVKVTITTSGNAIESIEVEANDETPAVGGAAIDPLKEAAMTAQSAEIDAVAGATFTSDGFKAALADAIEQAKKAN